MTEAIDHRAILARLTESEFQLIEIIREQKGGDFRLEIKLQDGAWEVLLSNELSGKKGVRGTGTGFDAAWEDAGPTEDRHKDRR
jgi:hypothetical protein